MCDYRRGMDKWMDLLTTYTHNSEVQQVISVLLLVSTIYRSLHNNGDTCYNIIII
jgi:hypothetical protein